MAKYSNEVVYNIKTTLDSSGITKLQNELTALQKRINSTSGRDVFGKGFSEEQVQRYSTAISSLRGAITKCFNPSTGMLNLQKFNKYLSSSTGTLKDLNSAFKATGAQGVSSFNSLVTSVTRLTPAATKANSVLSKMATTMGNTVRWGITAGLFQEMVSSISGAVSYVKDLDESLTQIQMVTGESASNMRELAQYANKAAQSLATTTTDYTNAVKIFAQEGFTTEESKLQANLSVKLANVSEQDTATTADQLTAYRNAFGLSIDEVTRSLDKVANVANSTASNVEELMTAAQRSASVAASIGASEDAFLASIATIQSVTRQSSEEIGNGLKTIYQRFADIKLGGSTDDGVEYGEYAQALQKVGVEVVDASGQFKGMDQILSELQNVWGTLDDTTKIAVGEKVAGKFQYNRFAALMNNQDYYDKAYAATQNADGMMDQMQDIYADSIEGRLNSLQAAGEQVMTTLFNQDAIEPILGDITALINNLNTLITTAGGLTPVLTTLSGIMLKTFSSQISSNILNISHSLQTSFSAIKNSQDMSTTLSKLGIVAEGLGSSSYGIAMGGASVMSGASSGTQQAWSKSMDQMVEAENRAKIAAEELSVAQERTNESIFKQISYTEALEIAQEDLKQANASVSNLNGIIEKEEQKLNKARQEATEAAREEAQAREALAKAEEIEATKEQNLADAAPKSKGGSTTARNKAVKNKELAKAAVSDAAAKRKNADSTIKTAQESIDNAMINKKNAEEQQAYHARRVASLEKVQEVESGIEDKLQKKVNDLKNIGLSQRKNLNIEETLLKIAEDEAVAYKKALEIKLNENATAKQKADIEREVASFRADATAAARKEAAALQEYLQAEREKLALAEQTASLNRQAAEETLANGFTKTLGNMTLVVSAGQMLLETIKTLTDESSTLEEKINAVAMNGLMGFSMMVPAITSTIQQFREEAKAIAILNATKEAEIIINNANKASKLRGVAAETAENATKAQNTKLTKENAGEKLKAGTATEAEVIALYQETAAEEANNLTLGQSIKKTLAHTAATIANTAALVAETAAQWAANSAAAPFIIALAAIAAVAGVVVLAINAVSDGYNKFSEATSQAQENLQLASNNLNNATEKLQTFKDALNQLDSDQNAFDGLTEGTKEWDDAINQANSDAISFLTTYRDILTSSGEFKGDILTTGAHGEKVVTEEAKDYVGKQLNNQVTSATYQKSAASRQVDKAKQTQNAVSIVREKGLDQNAGLMAGLHTVAADAALGATLGMAGGATAGGVGALPGAIIGGIGGAILGIGRAGEAAANAEEEYANKMTEAAKGISSGAVDLTSFDKFKSTLLDYDQSFASYSDDFLQKMFDAGESLKDLGDTATAQAAVERTEAKTAAESAMSNSTNYKNASTAERDVITSAMANESVEGGKYYDDAKAAVDKYSEEELKQAFADLNDSIEYVDGKFYEIGDDGKRTEIEGGYSTDYMTGAVIADQMSENVQKYGEELAAQISKANFNDDQIAALQAYTNNKTVTIEGKEQNYVDYINKEGISSLEEFVAALQSGSLSVKGLADATDKISSASTFGQLSAAKKAADEQDGNNKTEQAETKKAYEAQLESITTSEAEKYDLDYDEIVAQAEALADAFELDEAASRELAIQNQRMNKGVEELSENWEDWSDILKKSNKYDQDYVKTAKKLNSTIADLVGSSEDLNLSDEFYDSAENMALLEEAANGSEDAINQLGFAVGKDLVQNMEIAADMTALVNETTEKLNESGDNLDLSSIVGQIYTAIQNFDQNKQTVIDGLNQISAAGLSVGQSVSDAFESEEMYNNWVNSLNEMALATGMTATEMNTLLGTIGMHADVTTKTVTMPQQLTVTHKRTSISNQQYDDSGKLIGFDSDEEAWTETKEGDPVQVPVACIETGEGSGGITYIGGGTVGSSNKPSGSSGGSGGGGGGGGGGSSKKKRTDKADKNERDPLIEIENAIDRQTAVLEEQDELSDELYGSDKIANLNKVIASHEKLADLYEQELTLQEQQIALQQNQSTDEYGNLTVKGLAEKVGMTVEYNEDDDITNGKQIQEALYNAYKQAYDEETEHSDEDDYSAYTEEAEKWKDLYDQWVDAESSYGDMIDNMEDINSNIRAEIDAIQDANDEIVDTLQDGLDAWLDILNSQKDLNSEIDEFINGAQIKNTDKDNTNGIVSSAVSSALQSIEDLNNWQGTVVTKDGEKQTKSMSQSDYEKYSNQIEKYNSTDINTVDFMKLGVSKADGNLSNDDMDNMAKAIASGDKDKAQSVYDEVVTRLNNDNSLSYDQKTAYLDKYKKFVDQAEDDYSIIQKAKKASAQKDLTYTSMTGTSPLNAALTLLNDRWEDAKDAFSTSDSTKDFTQEVAYTNLQDALSSATEVIETLQENMEEISEAIADGIGTMSDLIDKQLELYDNFSDSMDSYSSINDMVNGDSELGRSTRIQIDNATINALTSKFETLNAGIQKYQEVLNKYTNYAQQNGGLTLEQLKTSNLISQTEADAIQDAQDKVTELQQEQMDTEENLLETIADRLETQANQTAESFANGLLGADVDWMQEEWEMNQRNEDLYLDDMNRAYNIQKLQYSYSELLNDSANQNSLIQQKISDQMNDQLAYLQEKTALSQTDINYANAQLEILEKQIALEDAQSAKTQMKLQRDASGNYSYVYTADEDDVAQKQQDLLDAQINAYNIAKEALLQSEEDTISEIQNVRDKIVEIWTDGNLDAQERSDRITELMDSLRVYTEAQTDNIKTYSLETLQSVAQSTDQISEENQGNLSAIYETLQSNATEALFQIDERFREFGENTKQKIDLVNTDIGTLATSMVALHDKVNTSSVQTLEAFTSLETGLLADMSASLDIAEESTSNALGAIGTSIGGLTNSVSLLYDEFDNLNKLSFKILTDNLDDIVKQITAAATALYGEDGSGGLRKTMIDTFATFKGLSSSVSQWLAAVQEDLLGTTEKIADLNDITIEVDKQAQIKKEEKASNSSGSGSSSPSLDIGSWISLKSNGKLAYRASDYPTLNPYYGTGPYEIIGTYGESYLLSIDGYGYTGWTRKDQIEGYDTGGYTGNWYDQTADDKNGKLAMLHQKELVLNASDTENLLDIIKQVRQMQDVDLSQMFNVSGLISSASDTIEQRVEITAEFPSVTSSQEIEQALLNLADSAYQAAHKNY